LILVKEEKNLNQSFCHIT